MVSLKYHSIPLIKVSSLSVLLILILAGQVTAQRIEYTFPWTLVPGIDPLPTTSEEFSTEEDQTKNFSFGLKLGYVRSNHLSDDTADYSADFRFRTSYCLGVFTTFAVNRFFIIQPQIFYLEKGAKYQDFGISIEEELTYLETQVLFKLLFLPGKVKPNLFFGPYISTLLQAKLSGNGNNENIIDDTNRGDAGYLIGLGVDVSVGTNIVTVDFSKSTGYIGVFEDTLRNETLALTVGYYF